MKLSVHIKTQQTKTFFEIINLLRASLIYTIMITIHAEETLPLLRNDMCQKFYSFAPRYVYIPLCMLKRKKAVSNVFSMTNAALCLVLL